jgi:hypothetical protein
MRICRVSARDTTARTLTVELGGDDQNPVAGVRIANTSYYPRVNDLAVVVQQRSDLYALGAVNAQIGHARVWGATDTVMNQLPTINTIVWQTQLTDTDGLWSSGTTMTLPWPGMWDLAAGIEVSGGTDNTVRRGLDIVAGGEIVDRDEHTAATLSNAQTFHAFASRFFLAGDTVTVQFYQGGGGAITLVERAETSPTLSATWRGPGG